MVHRVVFAIMDGVGERSSDFGNAVNLARTPNLDSLKQNSLYRTLYAHGTYVGLPSDDDMGNSEVGHNALGAGRIIDQGAKLVQKAIGDGSIFQGKTWSDLVTNITKNNSTLHLIGLLSDGNVHSHENHLYAIMNQAKKSGIHKVRIHVLTDGRDVGELTAKTYSERLEHHISQLKDPKFDIAVASGGGRMNVTMDRYEADWSIVHRGWDAHVHGKAPYKFPSLSAAIDYCQTELNLTDQYYPPFVIEEKGQPVGKINDNDAVVFFNFRGDRAIEICRAFTEEQFSYFDRGQVPKVFFAGMMQYDGDLNIPPKYLVSPPKINNTVSEYLVGKNIQQFACSETQKYGHVTYFWNGNKSGYFSEKSEEYIEVPSDRVEFDQKPEMKAKEITDVLLEKIKDKSFDLGRINFANGDMVGHTGKLNAAIKAMEIVDQQIGRIVEACEKTNTILVVSADHGNCDEMFAANEKEFPDWQLGDPRKISPKTSHTLNPVPFIILDPSKRYTLCPNLEEAGLANVANTLLELLDVETRDIYQPSVVRKKTNG